MASYQNVVSMLVFVCTAVLAVQQTAAARTLIRHTPAAAAVASSSKAVGGHHRRMLAAPSSPAKIVPVDSAPLPVDAYVVASPCPATTAAPGSTGSAVFTVGATMGAELLKGVSIQVDYPKALWPTATLSCKATTAEVIDCAAPPTNPTDLEAMTVAATACMLGDLAITGPVTCTFTYTTPATALPGGVNSRQIIASIAYADLPANVVEDTMNNAAATCVAAA